ncbi:hypothetical protein CVT25_003349, partial [Psilocybe cyanescens]
ECDGRLNFATDAWTSPNHKAYVTFTIHFEHNGEAMAMLLYLVEVPRLHTGANLADAFVDVLQAFGIKEKILSITADNASNNDTMIDCLSVILDNFPAKSVIKQFDVPKAKSEQSTRDIPSNEEGSEDKPADTWVDFREGLSEEERKKLDVSIQPVRSMLVKLHKVAFALNSTTLLLPTWYEALTTHHLPRQMMLHNVSTHWNSTFD